MIVVRLELWKGGDSRQKELLGVGIISNDGTGGDSIGNYTFSLTKRLGQIERETLSQSEISLRRTSLSKAW